MSPQTQEATLDSEIAKLSRLLAASESGTSRKDGEKQDGRQDASEEWEQIIGDFTSIWAMNVPWAASDMYVAPRCHLESGTIDLSFIQKVCSLL